MIRKTPWPAGTPCWADLTVPDLALARGFYGAVLGWEFSGGGEEFGGYLSATRRGAAAAGIGPEHGASPRAWTLYFAADDVDATAAAVGAAGGQLLVAPVGVGALGRMAVAADPTGAVFGVWQAGTHIGASLVDEPGGIIWEHLRTPDPQRAVEFYVAVFGFATHSLAESGQPDVLFMAPGEDFPLGGIGPLNGEPEAGARWIVYFGVDDAAAAAAAAEGQGGRVVERVVDTPYGRSATLADPFGATFTITENTGQPVPDRAE